MIWYLVSMAIIMACAYFNNFISKKFLYPPTVFSLLWFFVIGVHLVYVKFYNPSPNQLSFKTLAFFTIIPILFTIGGAIAKSLSNTWPEETEPNPVQIKSGYLNAILIISSVALYAFIERIREITRGSFDMRVFRDSISNQGEELGVVQYAVPFILFSMIVHFISFMSNNKLSGWKHVRFYLMIIITVAMCVLSSGRGVFLLLTMALGGIYSTYKRINVKQIFKVVSGLFGVFIFMAVLLKKTMPNKAEKGIAIADQLFFLIYSYVCLPLSAFDHFFTNPYDLKWGDHLFRFPKIFLYKLKVISEPPAGLVEGYVKVPDPVNVYTSYFKLVGDFGPLYAMIVMLVFGTIHTLLYFKSKNNLIALILYALLLFPLMMSFFEENLISLVSTWLQYIFLILITKKFVVKC